MTMKASIVIVVGLAVLLRCTSMAFAQSPYGLSFHIDGIPGDDGNGNLAGVSYSWGAPGENLSAGASSKITLTHIVQTSSVSLMQEAQTHQLADAAEVQVSIQGTTTIEYQMTNVRFDSIEQRFVTPLPSQSPPSAQVLESITLSFKQLDYTFQPVNVVGQKNGAPESITFKF
jgi:hypothetical protein